jgi:hypothetical protein
MTPAQKPAIRRHQHRIMSHDRRRYDAIGRISVKICKLDGANSDVSRHRQFHDARDR